MASTKHTLVTWIACVCVSKFHFLVLNRDPNTHTRANDEYAGLLEAHSSESFAIYTLCMKQTRTAFFSLILPSRFPWKFIVKNPQPKTPKYKSSRFVLLCLDTAIYCKVVCGADNFFLCSIQRMSNECKWKTGEKPHFFVHEFYVWTNGNWMNNRIRIPYIFCIPLYEANSKVETDIYKYIYLFTCIYAYASSFQSQIFGQRKERERGKKKIISKHCLRITCLCIYFSVAIFTLINLKFKLFAFKAIWCIPFAWHFNISLCVNNCYLILLPFSPHFPSVYFGGKFMIPYLQYSCWNADQVILCTVCVCVWGNVLFSSRWPYEDDKNELSRYWLPCSKSGREDAAWHWKICNIWRQA